MFFSSLDINITQYGLMAMAEDHGIIIGPELSHCKGMHFFDQIISLIIIHLFARPGCQIGQCPEDGNGNRTLYMIKWTAA